MVKIVLLTGLALVIRLSAGRPCATGCRSYSHGNASSGSAPTTTTSCEWRWPSLTAQGPTSTTSYSSSTSSTSRPISSSFSTSTIILTTSSTSGVAISTTTSATTSITTSATVSSTTTPIITVTTSATSLPTSTDPPPTSTSSSPSLSSLSTATTQSSTSTAVPGPTWQPAVGTTWNYVLDSVLSSSTSKGGFDIWDIDLFDNQATTIASLHNQGAKVICYFSAGTYEDWRPDKDQFSQADLGNSLPDWPGERWLNTRSDGVRQIMLKRLDLAVQQNCDGVDPDDIDGYNNDNGLGLTQADAIDYILFLANAAHQRGLSIGLKNAGEIISSVIGEMQWSVNESCVEFNECATFQPFVAQGKPVFHVEYPAGGNTNSLAGVSIDVLNQACDGPSTQGFSTILKDINLDSWTETCSGVVTS